MIWTANRKGASCAAYCTASEIITVARQSAECTGLRDRIMPSAASTITGASSQKATPAAVTSGSINTSLPLGGGSVDAPAPLLVALVDQPRLGPAEVAGAVVGTAGAGQPEEVCLLVVTGSTIVRRRVHARQQRREQPVLLVDQGRPAVVGELELVRHGQRPRRAGLDAQA